MQTEKKILLKVNSETKEAEEGFRRLEKKIGGVSKSSHGIENAFRSVTATAGKMALGIGAVAGAVGGVGLLFAKLSGRAGELEQVTADFNALSESIGETSETMMGSLKRATKGTISQFDSMQIGSKLMQMGLAKNSEEMERLVSIATRLGDKTVSVKDNVENFSLLLANQSIQRLDSFGISSGVVATKVEQLMEANKGMTRETAFMTATLEEADRAMGILGDTQNTAGLKVAQLRAKLEDLRDKAILTLAPHLLEIAEKYIPKAIVAIEGFASKVPDYIETVSSSWSGFIRGWKQGTDSLEYDFSRVDQATDKTGEGFRDFDGDVITAENAMESLGIVAGGVAEAITGAWNLMTSSFSVFFDDLDRFIKFAGESLTAWKDDVVNSIEVIIDSYRRLLNIQKEVSFGGGGSGGRGESRNWETTTDKGSINKNTNVTINAYNTQANMNELAGTLNFLIATT